MKITGDHLSYSSFDMYLNCPEAWRRKYILGEPARESIEDVFCFVLRKTLQRIIKSNASSGWSGIWIEEFDKNVFYENLGIREHYCNEGIRLLSHPTISKTISNIRAKMVDREIELYVPYEVDVPFASVPIIGNIDVILDDGSPADFEISSKLLTDIKVGKKIKSLFCLAALNQERIGVGWKFTNFIFVINDDAIQVQVLKHSYKPEEVYFLYGLIRYVFDGISNDIYPAKPKKWLCDARHCNYYTDCRGKYI